MASPYNPGYLGPRQVQQDMLLLGTLLPQLAGGVWPLHCWASARTAAHQRQRTAGSSHASDNVSEPAMLDREWACPFTVAPLSNSHTQISTTTGGTWQYYTIFQMMAQKH